MEDENSQKSSPKPASLAEKPERCCVKCKTWNIKIVGGRKIIVKKDQVANLKALLGITVRENDYVCNKCRQNGYNKKRKLSTKEKTSSQPPKRQRVSENKKSLPVPLTKPVQIKPVTSRILRTRTKGAVRPTNAIVPVVHKALTQQEDSFCSSNGVPSENSLTKDPSFRLEELTDDAEETVVIPFPRVVSTHSYCFLCNAKQGYTVVPFEARIQMFRERRIHIPLNRCYPGHLINNRIYEDQLGRGEIFSRASSIPVSELTAFLNTLSEQSNASLLDEFKNNTATSDSRLRALTGYDSRQIQQMTEMLTSLRNSSVGHKQQALCVFLFKLRTGNSNNVLASIMNINNQQTISQYFDSVLNAFETDVLPPRFGIGAHTRKYLIEDHTSPMVEALFGIKSKLVLVCDGTYLRHEKSTNNAYQRKSYSGQKKTHLCKPFTICTTDGFVVDVTGPYDANKNDAGILRILMEDPDGLSRLLQPGDVLILDRGFRDIVKYLKEKGYRVLMPALKGTRSQLTSKESNESRFVTKLRWVVESVHGGISQQCQMLHHQFDNKMLPKPRTIIRTANFLYNTFNRRLNSDEDNIEEVVQRMLSRKKTENKLAETVEQQGWKRKKLPFEPLTSESVQDFPRLTGAQLKILFTGTYQLGQAVSYLGEVLQKGTSHIMLHLLKESTEREKVLKMCVQSRHINRKEYRCFIKYKPNTHDLTGILSYCCECANGNRTVGTCSHIAAIIYYLATGRYKSKIVCPSQLLTNLFSKEKEIQEVAVDENSDED